MTQPARRLLALALPAAALLASLAGTAPAATVYEDLVPGGTVQSTLAPSSEVEIYRVVAAAGSTLSLDLRPTARGEFFPALASVELDGVPVAFPGPAATGRTKAKIVFPSDGTLEVRVRSGSGTSGDYALRTALRAPRGAVFSGTVAPGVATEIPLFAPAQAVATLQVKRAKGSPLVPRFDGLTGAGSSATAITPDGVRETPAASTWKGVALPAAGAWTLGIVGDGGSGGPFTGKVKWKVQRGGSADYREVSLPGALQGPYRSFLVSVPTLANPTGSVLTGDVVFDGRGGVTTALRTLVLLPDAGSPLGIGFQVVDIPPGTGTYFTDGKEATLTLDLGTGTPMELPLRLGAGGNVLLPATPPEFGPSTVGVLLKGAATPTTASLAGSWFYINYEAGDAGAGSVEIGTLSLSSGGVVSGLGAGISLDLVEGTPTPGVPVPTLRTGTVSVDGSGRVTFSTVANLFGPLSTWTAEPVFLQDILLGRGPDEDPGSVLRTFLRQGTGLDASAVEGAYLHMGLYVGAETAVRTGNLVFDGSGNFAGPDAVFDLTGGTVTPAVPTEGTYTVSASGTATFTRTGAATGNGIVGPEGDYLLTLALDASGLALDFLLYTYGLDEL